MKKIKFYLRANFFLFIMMLLMITAKAEDYCYLSQQYNTIQEKPCSKCFVLELVQLEGKGFNLQDCRRVDSQAISLEPREKLVIILKKKPLCHPGSLLNKNTDYDIQARTIIRNYDGWKNWFKSWEDASCIPLKLLEFNSNESENYYSYCAGDVPGVIDLSFISYTIPRYYSSLHVTVHGKEE